LRRESTERRASPGAAINRSGLQSIEGDLYAEPGTNIAGTLGFVKGATYSDSNFYESCAPGSKSGKGGRFLTEELP
jgi:hypothetical protein